MSNPMIDAWHDVFGAGNDAALRELLAEQASFHSSAEPAPQRGRDLVASHLAAAGRVFADSDFRYVREIAAGHDAALEFTVTLDGVAIDGIHLIHWDAWGRIDDFKVMVRPAEGIDKLREKLAAELEHAPA